MLRRGQLLLPRQLLRCLAQHGRLLLHLLQLLLLL
jgi:hypothetical protein